MKKLTTILLMFSALSLFAQSPAVSVPQETKKMSLHFEAGVNNFQFHGNSHWNNTDISTSHFEALTLEKELNSSFSISLGFRNVNYGIKYSEMVISDMYGNIVGKIKDEINLNYWTIQMPLQVIIKPFKSKKLSFNFGGYLGYNYFNSSSVSNPLITFETDNNKNLIDKGLIVGLDYTWFKRGNFKLGNSISYYRGFNNIAPNSTYVTRNSQGLNIAFIGTLGF